MAKFEVAGQTYDSDDISESQKQLVSSLSFTKELNKEIELKMSLLIETKKILEKVWENEVGSKIVDTVKKKTGTQVKLANGKKLNFSKLSEKPFIPPLPAMFAIIAPVVIIDLGSLNLPLPSINLCRLSCGYHLPTL